MLNIPQLPRIQTKDTHVHDALKAIRDYVNAFAQQIGLDANGVIPKPLPPQAITVAQDNGLFRVSLTDNNPTGRLLHYFVQYANDKNFTSPITVPLETSRDCMLYLGADTYFIRGFSQYFGSNQSDKVVYGGGNPIAVTGGGSVPPRLGTQGSGGGVAGGDGFGGVGDIIGSNDGQGPELRIPPR